MKELSCGYVWWPNIAKDIEMVARNCVGCREIANNPARAPPISRNITLFPGKDFIKHVTGAPYHPSTNGKADRMVQILKKRL